MPKVARNLQKELARAAGRAVRTAAVANRGSPYLYGPFGTTIGRRPMRKPMVTSTPKGTKRTVARGGAALHSKSRGFLKKGLRKRRYMKKKVVKFSIGGTNRTIEASKIQTGTDAVWIGHGTYARESVLREGFIAMLYSIFLKAQFISEAMSVDTTIDGLPFGAGVNMTFSYQPSAGANSVNLNYSIAASNDRTLAAMWTWFSNAARPWNTQNTDLTQIQFNELRIADASRTYCYENLKLFKLKIFVKSAMKIQNRTLAVAGTGEDPADSGAVDAVPLYGKSYSGKGTALFSMTPYNPNTGAASDLITDQTYGVVVGSESLSGRSEPLQPSEFRNAKSSGKIHLDPGEIKTSVLTSSYTLFFNTLLKDCLSVLTATNTLTNLQYRNRGKFRVFALEKMINVTGDNAISVAFEVNQEISCKAIRVKANPGVIKSFTKNFLP